MHELHTASFHIQKEPTDISKTTQVDLPICASCAEGLLLVPTSTPQPTMINGQMPSTVHARAIQHYLQKRKLATQAETDKEQQATEITTLKAKLAELEQTKPPAFHTFSPETTQKLQQLQTMGLFTCTDNELADYLDEYNKQVEHLEAVIHAEYTRVANEEMDKFDRAITAILAVDPVMQSTLSGVVDQLRVQMAKWVTKS